MIVRGCAGAGGVVPVGGDGGEALFTTSLQENGVATTRARRLATLVVTAVEGSVAVCRAERSTRALDDVAVELDALLSAVTTARDE